MTILEAPFQSVDLHIFDVHTTVKPLISDSCVREEFRFLTNAEAYRQQYAKPKTLVRNSFDFHPLSRHAQTRNQFWSNYLTRVDEPSIDYWNRQAPFLASLTRPFVSLSKDLSFEGRVTPVVYLSPLGWSSNLNIHLRGAIQLKELLNFLLGILGPTGDSGLLMEGEPAKVAEIFKTLASRFSEVVYDPADPPRTGTPEIAKHMVVSLAKFGGPPLRYQRTSSTKGMTTAEQAMLHSLIRGEVIGTKEFAEKLRKPSPTVVSFGAGPDLMLIYFERGALIFMQEYAVKKGKRQRALSCLASNTRSFAIMAWTLFHFHRLTQNATNPAVKEMRALVENNLLAMKEGFSSTSETMRGSVKYAEALFRNQPKFKELLSKAKS